jgi:DNA-binding CsgD family transcriptional regulator
MARITNNVREKIFSMKARGYSIREIADALDLTEAQVVKVLGL